MTGPEPQRIDRNHDIHSMSPEALSSFVVSSGHHLTEQNAIDVLRNRHCKAEQCRFISQNQRLVGFYSVRLALVAHPATPRGDALRLIHYLYWNDLLRLSINMRLAGPLRRAVDVQLINRLPELALGARISSARLCSRDLIQALLSDPHQRVFRALLDNPYLKEEDLVGLIGSGRASAEQMILVSSHRKWSFRYLIRKALVLNDDVPRAVAASQLRHLMKRDLEGLLRNPRTSVYLRRCIEQILPQEQPPSDAVDPVSAEL